MKSFLPCRGIAYLIGNGGSSSSFALSPPLRGNSDSPILLQSFRIFDKIIELPITTLDGAKILYIFGKAWGDISVGGLALLGEGGTGSALAEIINFWNAHNSWKKNSHIKMSIPGSKAFNLYLTSLTIGDPNAEFQFFPFTFTGKLAH